MVATATPLRALEPVLSDEELLHVHKHMLRLRALDARMVELQRAGKVAFHASWAGEEAAICGAASALRDKDWVFHSGREVGAALLRGMPLGVYLSHAFGSARDVGKGRQIPGGLGHRPTRFAPSSALTGTQITHAVGFAWAARMREKNDAPATLVFFGDGATSSGDFHNGMNFAGVFKAPVVFLCRNNGWAQGTPVARQTASSSLAVKAVAYGLPGRQVDGGDVRAVYAAVRAAVISASRGEGATLLEVLVSRDEDPIPQTQKYLESRRLFTDKAEAEHMTRVRAEIDLAVSVAMEEGPPAHSSLVEDVFADVPWNLREARAAADRTH